MSKGRKQIRTTMGGILLLAGVGAFWKIREQQINREIDEFDRIMRELKKEACERKEETKCCQIKSYRK